MNITTGWFLLAGIGAVIAILITIKKPLWGTLASTICAMLIGLKVGALIGVRWPKTPEIAALIGLAVLSYIITKRKWRAWEESHPLYRALKEIEAYQQELAALTGELEAMGGHVDKEE